MNRQKGMILPALMIICGAFIVVIYGLLFVLTLQFDFSNRQTASENAINIAEAGVNYYRWHLAHDPADFQDGTGGAGPYLHDYLDPQGAKVGTYSLEIIPPENGSSMVTIKSTGWVNQYPNVKRVIEAQYGKQSLAKYSFLQNASSWYGTNITVNGQVHSNNGVRMDGNNLSLVTSAKETYVCGSETGCNPSQTKPGVWGSGANTGLWQFPIPAIDFASISFDFAEMKDNAIDEGLYLGQSGSRGYHMVFVNNGTVRVYRVTGTNYYNAYDVDDGCQRRYERITSETLLGTYNISSVPIIFAEDHLWVEGVVKGRTTVAAVRFPIETNSMNIWIKNNITYTTYSGADILGLLAQKNIYFTRDVPTNFQIDAILMAQSGKIIRYGYLSSCGSTTGAVKNKLTINGSIISYNKSYWNYGTSPTSGFITREINYDPHVLYAPPPYFPTSGDYEFVSWKEE